MEMCISTSESFLSSCIPTLVYNSSGNVPNNKKNTKETEWHNKNDSILNLDHETIVKINNEHSN